MANIDIEKLLLDLIRYNKFKRNDYIDCYEILEALKEQGILYNNGKFESTSSKPKYNVGDWVIFNCGDRREICQISDITSNIYKFSDGTYLAFNEESMLEKWSIDNAKPGDFLFIDYICDYYVYIFKGFTNDAKNSVNFYSTDLDTYCTYSSKFETVRFGQRINRGLINRICPASKGEIDNLMKRLDENGYIWNPEKLEIMKKNKFNVGDLIHYISDPTNVCRVVEIIENGDIKADNGSYTFTIIKDVLDDWVLKENNDKNKIDIDSMVEKYKNDNFVPPFGDQTNFNNYVNAMACAYRQGLIDMQNKYNK